jgi:hypothetical protein
MIAGLLYFGLLFAASMQFENVSKGLLKSTAIAGLNNANKALKPRQFDRTDFKLLSVSPTSDSLSDPGSAELHGLAYDTKGGAGTWADKLDKGQEILKTLKTTANKAVKPEPKPKYINLYVSAVMNNGAVVNGRFIALGESLVRGYPVSLEGVDQNHNSLTLSVHGERGEYHTENGVLTVLVKS